ncbi:MAG: hypothetical protein EOO63_00260 [Hymenobacter sp.]|nr:MAG: hypothetical protein EOO63_00260 [Hymenobacter sp.]
MTFTTPTTVSSITTATASPTNATSISYPVTFGASVTGVTISNFTLTASGLTGATISSVAGSGTTYTVVVDTGPGSGTLQLNLANSSGLTPSVLNVPFAGPTTTIDKTSPTITSVAVPANGTYRAGQVLSFTVNFSDAVTVTGTPQLGLTLDTGGSVPANYASGSSTAALVFSYTIVAGNADGNGITVGTLALNGGTIRDVATNNATLTLNGVPATTGVLMDGIAPTVTSINRQTPTATTTNAASLTYRVTFSEAVAGVTANDFSPRSRIMALTSSAAAACAFGT